MAQIFIQLKYTDYQACISSVLRVFLINLFHLPLTFPPYPFSFFYLVRDVRKFSLFQDYLHHVTPNPSPAYFLKTNILLPGQMLLPCQCFLTISSWVGCSFTLLHFFTHLGFLIVFQLFARIKGQRLKTTWDQKAYTFILISSIFRKCPKPNIQLILNNSALQFLCKNAVG